MANVEFTQDGKRYRTTKMRVWIDEKWQPVLDSNGNPMLAAYEVADAPHIERATKVGIKFQDISDGGMSSGYFVRLFQNIKMAEEEVKRLCPQTYSLLYSKIEYDTDGYDFDFIIVGVIEPKDGTT